jgi:hypothetical protein
MALTIAQGFDAFLARLVPLESQRAAATKHRARVEASLQNALDVRMFREVGSFNHGTGIRGCCDVDLLVSLKTQPGTSDTALRWVKEALTASFPSTKVRISRPAVVIEFAGGSETWEVLPAFRKAARTTDTVLYNIPGVATPWLESAPLEHNGYVNEVNQRSKIKGAAKKLTRLVKAWKYYNSVPISSFYLEMRAAQYMAGETSFIPVWDICRLLEHLNRIDIGPMNDPRQVAGRFYACSTEAKGKEAISKVSTAAIRARKAAVAHKEGNSKAAFHYLNLLFGGRFPAR